MSAGVSIALPSSADALKTATWDDVAPYYEELTTRRLDETNVEEWLADWSAFEALLNEATSLANFAYSCNTADPEREEARLRFFSEIEPKAEEQRSRLQARLVRLDYTRPGLESMLKRFRNQLEIFNEANVPLFAQLARLSTEWAKLIGAMTVQWEGEDRTPQQMQPYLEEQDRDVRERAFRAMFKPYIDQRGALADLFNRMYDVRVQVAKNAGFDNFRDYVHREKNRFDYTPDDCFRFHESVEIAVQPAVKRLMERRRRLLGVDRLRPWDVGVDPKGRTPLRPYKDIDEFVDRTRLVFEKVHPDF